MASEDSSPPNKRMKTLAESPTFNLKGKEKIEEIGDENEQESMEADSKVCGICFSEDGMAIRGAIDSCNHHFCFVCIMEWSKIESRCPLCKQRFSTIRRPPKDGVFLRERIVNVPIRDQVWHPYGNMSTGPSDPYGQVECTECHRSVDECLLLLCDLCDSAAHTYCIGLGATIPEGDWYCHDCSVSRDDHTSSQIDTDCSNQEFGSIGTVRLASVNVSTSRNDHTNSQMDVNCSRTNDTTRVAGANVSISGDDHTNKQVDTYGYNRDSSHTDTARVVDENVLISEIVQESYEREVDRSSRRIVLPPDQLSPPEAHVRNIGAGTIATDPSARTLRRCRNVQNRIHVLRENWNALRSGSLGFASNLTDSSSQNSKKDKNRPVAYEKPSLPQSSSSTCLQVLNNENAAGEALNKQGSCDTDKAWKMLDIAKSFQKARDGKNNKHGVSNHQLVKRKVPMEVTVTGPCFSSSKSKKDVGGSVSEKNCMNHSLGIAHRKHKTRATENLKPGRDIFESWKLQNGHLSTTHTSRYCKLSSDRQVQELVQLDVCHENIRKLPLKKIMHGVSSGLISEQVSTPSTVSLSESILGGSVPTYNRSEFDASFGCKRELPRENGGLDNISATVMARKDDDAKSEVQSLVKLNLKLLNREKQLGVDGFKEVARLATHTILAACGLEHKTSSVRPFPSSICTHNNQNQQQRMSNLMPRSCRECFYVFVKDVVSSIMTDKITCIPSIS